MDIKPIYSQEAEKAVIGSVLINPEVIKVLDLNDTDFYRQDHAEIWRVFQHINITGSVIDIVSVQDRLPKFNVLEYIGDVPSSLHAKEYAAIIREKARRRDLVLLAGEIAKSGYDEHSDLETQIPQFMSRLVANAGTEGSAVHISKILSELYDAVQERHADPKEIWGIPTGLYDYDILTGGHHQGEMTLMSGKAGLGKSLLAMQMAFGMAETSAGAVYELEMGRIQTVRRQVSSVSRVKARALRSGSFDDGDWDKFTGAIAELEHKPIYLSDHTGWTTASLRADLARLKAQYGIKWFVLDYIQLLNDRYGKDDSERIGYISRLLKNICKDLDLSGLVINSMIKSEMESEKPSLAAQRGSGQLIFDADVIFYLVEDGDKNLKIHFAKFREDTPERFIRLTRDDGFPAFKCASQPVTYRTPYKD